MECKKMDEERGYDIIKNEKDGSNKGRKRKVIMVGKG